MNDSRLESPCVDFIDPEEPEVEAPICLACENGDHGQTLYLVDMQCECPCHGGRK